MGGIGQIPCVMFDRLAADHATAGDALFALLDEAVAAARQACDDRREPMVAAVRRRRDTKKALEAAGEGEPAAFSRPRTKRHAGIEYGWATARDVVRTYGETADLIRKPHPELATALLKAVLVKSAAIKLPAIVRRLRIRVSRGQDAPFVRRVRDLDVKRASIVKLVGA